MGECSSMSISADSPLDETLTRGTSALLLHRQYEFPFGIDIVQFCGFGFFFSIFNTILNELWYFGACLVYSTFRLIHLDTYNGCMALNHYSSTILWRGYIFTSVCLCLCECLSVCEQNANRTATPICTRSLLNSCLLQSLESYWNWWPWVKGQGHFNRKCI